MGFEEPILSTLNDYLSNQTEYLALILVLGLSLFFVIFYQKKKDSDWATIHWEYRYLFIIALGFLAFVTIEFSLITAVFSAFWVFSIDYYPVRKTIEYAAYAVVLLFIWGNYLITPQKGKRPIILILGSISIISLILGIINLFFGVIFRITPLAYKTIHMISLGVILLAFWVTTAVATNFLAEKLNISIQDVFKKKLSKLLVNPLKQEKQRTKTKKQRIQESKVIGKIVDKIPSIVLALLFLGLVVFFTPPKNELISSEVTGYVVDGDNWLISADNLSGISFSEEQKKYRIIWPGIYGQDAFDYTEFLIEKLPEDVILAATCNPKGANCQQITKRTPLEKVNEFSNLSFQTNFKQVIVTYPPLWPYNSAYKRTVTITGRKHAVLDIEIIDDKSTSCTSEACTFNVTVKNRLDAPLNIKSIFLRNLANQGKTSCKEIRLKSRSWDANRRTVIDENKVCEGTTCSASKDPFQWGEIFLEDKTVVSSNIGMGHPGELSFQVAVKCD